MSEIKASYEARLLADQYDIDLTKIKGSGPGGEITVQDVEQYIRVNFLPEVKEKKSLSGIRKIIVTRLGKSYAEAIHVTLNMETSMDKLINFSEQLEEKLSEKPSYTILVAKCVARALRENLELNATFEGDEIIIYNTININIAVDTPFGLLTPVIRRVDEKDLKTLIKEYNDIVERARSGSLKQKDIVGGTFTITNLGMFDIDTFTPIINPPQIAILGVNRIVKKPFYDDKSKEIKIGAFMNLSLSFDHRAIDGAPAARFLQRVKYYIENPEVISWF